MSSTEITTEIATARAAFHGDYVSVTRVADTLLDLRALAGDRSALVELIDETLASIPGRSVASNDWWADALDTIERVASGDPSAQLGSVDTIDALVV